MADFYHMYIRHKGGVTADQVEEKMDLASDWFRHTASEWVLYTTSDANVWQARLLPLVEPDGSLFICRLDIGRYNGWMPQSFWDWIEKER